MSFVVEQSMQDLYDDFCFHFPRYADRAIDCYKTGKEELTVRLRGGDVIVFHGPTRGIRNVRTIDLDLEEERWRRLFGHQLARRIEERYSNYSIFADKIGVGRVMLSRYINGHSTPSVYIAAKMANALGCSMSELCDLE